MRIVGQKDLTQIETRNDESVANAERTKETLAGFRPIGDKASAKPGGPLDEETKEGLKRLAQMLRDRERGKRNSREEISQTETKTTPPPGTSEKTKVNSKSLEASPEVSIKTPVAEVISLAEFQARRRRTPARTEMWWILRQRKLGILAYHRMLDHDPADPLESVGQNFDVLA